jgi:hypothetical protein
LAGLRRLPLCKADEAFRGGLARSLVIHDRPQDRSVVW